MSISCLKVYFPEGDTLTEEEIARGPEVCTYFDEEGREVRKLEFGSEITYYYDDNGLLLQTRKRSNWEEIVCVNDYTADGELFHTRETVVHSDIQYVDGDSKDTWISWQDGGRLCKKDIICRHQNNEKHETIEERYNDNDQLVEMKHMAEWEYGWWIDSAEKNEYDVHGRMISSKQWSGDRLVCEDTYKYHENGNLSEVYSEERTELGHGENYISRRVDYYDENELLLKKENLSTGETIDFEYTFGDDGNWTMSKMINNDGVIVRVLRVFENWD